MSFAIARERIQHRRVRKRRPTSRFRDSRACFDLRSHAKGLKTSTNVGSQAASLRLLPHLILCRRLGQVPIAIRDHLSRSIASATGLFSRLSRLLGAQRPGNPRDGLENHARTEERFELHTQELHTGLRGRLDSLIHNHTRNASVSLVRFAQCGENS